MRIPKIHIVWLICLPLLPINITAQTEGTIHSVDNNTQQLLPISEPSLGSLTLHNSVQFSTLAPYTIHGEKWNADSLTNLFVKPQLTSTPYPAGFIGDNSPFRHDFATSNFFPLSSFSGISTFADYHTYLTIGAVADVSATYTRNIGRWSFTGGVFASKYSTMARKRFIPAGRPEIFNDYGINGSVDFKINNRFTLTAFGQYSFQGRKNAAASYLMPLMAPQSKYGFTVDTKVKDWLNVVSGIEHYYDPARMKWRTSPILYPEINLLRLFR